MSEREGQIHSIFHNGGNGSFFTLSYSVVIITRLLIGYTIGDGHGIRILFVASLNCFNNRAKI